jgi:hypothetical protein
MYDFLDSLGNGIVDRSVDELIGAVIVALGVSLAFAGLDFVARRKARDNRLAMIVVMIGANLASMAIAAGYLVHVRKTRSALARERNQVSPPGLDPILVESIFNAADKDRDGLLSSEEASLAAAEFVRRADPMGKGLIDAPILAQALMVAWLHRGRRPPGSSLQRPPPGGRSRSDSGPRRNDRRPSLELPPALAKDRASLSPDADRSSNDRGKEPGPFKK